MCRTKRFTKKVLSDVTYYIRKGMESRELRGCEAEYLLSHPRTALKWIEMDTGIRL